jgi:hypothetical protein
MDSSSGWAATSDAGLLGGAPHVPGGEQHLRPETEQGGIVRRELQASVYQLPGLADAAGLQQRRGQRLQEPAGGRAEVENVVVEAFGLVELALLQEQAPEHVVLLERLVRLAALHEGVGEVQADRVVSRVELHEPAQHAHGLVQLAFLLVPLGQDLELALGLDEQTLFEVEIRQALVDVHALGSQAVDLLQDRDGLGDEAVLPEVVGDPLVQGDGVLHAADAAVEVAHPVDGVGVVRVGLEQFFVLVDGLLDLAFLDKFFRCAQNFYPD